MWLDQLSVEGELQLVRGSFAFIPAAADRSYSLRVAMPTGDLALKNRRLRSVTFRVGEFEGGCWDGVRR